MIICTDIPNESNSPYTSMSSCIHDACAHVCEDPLWPLFVVALRPVEGKRNKRVRRAVLLGIDVGMRSWLSIDFLKLFFL